MVRRRSRSGKKSDQRRLVGLSVSGARGSTARRGTASSGPARRHGAIVILVLGALVLVNLYVFVWDKKTSVGAIKEQAEHATPALAIPAHPLENLAPAPAGPTTLVPAIAGSAAGSATAANPATPATPGEIVGKVGKSDTLGRLLKKNGLSGAEADEIIRALAGALDFKTIRAGQTFRIERGPDAHVRAFELVLNKQQTVRAERDDKGVMVAIAPKSGT